RVTRMQGTESSPDDSTGVLFVLEPTRRLEPVEARLTLDWVRRGGILVYAPSRLPTVTTSGISVEDGLGSELGVARRFGQGSTGGQSSSVVIPFPFFTTPPARQFVVSD